MDVPRDRSLGELVSDLSSQTSELFRQELRLAKAELKANLADAGWHAILIGIAIACGLAAVITIAAAITLLLIAIGVVAWFAALITAAVMGGIAYAFAQSGLAGQRRKSIAPVETIHSLKETTAWLKNPSTR